MNTLNEKLFEKMRNIWNMKNIILATSFLLLSSCKDWKDLPYNENQIKKDINVNDIDVTLKRNEELLYKLPINTISWIDKTPTMKITHNIHWEREISSDSKNININIEQLQDYCNNNNIQVIVSEDNKYDVLDAIVSIYFKDYLSLQWENQLWEYIFITKNKNSNGEDILTLWNDKEYINSYYLDNNQQDSLKVENVDTLIWSSIEDQWFLAEQKMNDSSLTGIEKRKRNQNYNELSTRLFDINFENTK